MSIWTPLTVKNLSFLHYRWSLLLYHCYNCWYAFFLPNEQVKYGADDSTMFWAIGPDSSAIAKHTQFCGNEVEMVVPFECANSGNVRASVNPHLWTEILYSSYVIIAIKLWRNFLLLIARFNGYYYYYCSLSILITFIADYINLFSHIWHCYVSHLCSSTIIGCLNDFNIV